MEEMTTGGSIGVHMSNPGFTAETESSLALISNNRIFGCVTAIQIDSSWSSCMVTDNLFEGSIVNNGTGNIVRLNSDDPGGDGGGSTSGVASFKGRTGMVTPQAGDYTAAMVGAVPAAAVKAIQSLTRAEYDALAVKDAATLYLIEG